MIKKIIGIILICFIFFLAIKSLTVLPTLSDWVIGPSKSPFQIGSDYIDQINKIYPMQSNYRSQTGYSVKVPANVASKITVEKSYGSLIVSVENGNPPPGLVLNIWLTNNDQITNDTKYIDFGILRKDVSLQRYVIDMKGGDVSLLEFNNIFFVDKNNNIYSKVILK